MYFRLCQQKKEVFAFSARIESAIGMQTALALKSAGYTVYELSRRAQGVEGLHHLVTDVTDEAAVKKAVDEIVAREGKIDVLVNNAGFGISGAVEFTKT